jgi:hypothetical protein
MILTLITRARVNGIVFVLGALNPKNPVVIGGAAAVVGGDAITGRSE